MHADNPSNAEDDATLFDDVPRHDAGPSQFVESYFRYLNRTARADAARVRTVLEEWFTGYPVTGRVDLRSRFRSPDDRSFFGAFFELYMHEVLCRLHYDVTLPPQTTSKPAPDFLAERSGQTFYVEATVALPQGERSDGAKRRIERARDTINAINSPDFLLWVEEHGEPTSDVRISQLRREISGFLSTLNYDAVREHLPKDFDVEALPRRSFEFHGWVVSVRAVPVSPTHRGQRGPAILTWGPSEMHRVDRVTAIRRAVRQKAGRYDPFGVPFVIAVNAASERPRHGDVMEALFGSEEWYSTPDHPKPRMTRAPDGVFRGPKGPDYTRVSAVIVAAMLSPWSVAETTLAVYRNPWAAIPLGEILGELPGYLPTGQQLLQHEGLGPREVFRLPDGWPDASKPRSGSGCGWI